MTVITRTNLVVNPSSGTNSTGYTAVAGTGGAAALTRVTTGGSTTPTFTRVTWSTATTAISGGCTYGSVTGLAAVTAYAMSAWVRSSITQKVYIGLDWNTSGGGYISTTASAALSLAANVWTQVFVTGTAPATATQGNLSVLATTGGANWTIGATLDVQGVLVEAGTTQGLFFDGSYVNANSVMYAWTSTANASTSTAKTYTPAIALVAKPTFDPCPRVEITISDVTPTDNIVTVWVTADGKRKAVRSARKWTVNGSNFVVDYEPALGRTVAYDLEVTSGLNYGAGVTQQTTTVNAAAACIQDPLVPTSAIPIYENYSPNGEPTLQGQAISALEYAAGMNLIQVIGSPDPVALMGQRLSAANVDFSMVTTAAQQTTNLRNLLQQAPVLLVRPLPTFGAPLPGLCYVASAKPVEQPQFSRWEGTVTKWELKGDLVAAPTMNVLVPVWTYGTVAALWGTYQAAQTALASKTYLDVLKSPSGV